MTNTSWHIFKGTGRRHPGIEKRRKKPPPWRAFAKDEPLIKRAEKVPEATLQARQELEPREIELINAAIFLRRPLLVTGSPGTGKSTLAHAIAHELMLGAVLEWHITTRSTLREGLYEYDAIGRAQERLGLEELGRYIKLGPLGTALLPTRRPRVLLIDELDKSDIDLPNDLLHVFEKGSFEIPELVRLPDEYQRIDVRPHDSHDRKDVVTLIGGQIRCRDFPIVVLTSNQEREFPPAFLRRCIRLDIPKPNPEKLARIVHAHGLPSAEVPRERLEKLLTRFVEAQETQLLATDQLLNAVFLATYHDMSSEELVNALFRALSPTGTSDD